MNTSIMNENEKMIMINKLEVEKTMDLLYGLKEEAVLVGLLITTLKSL